MNPSGIVPSFSRICAVIFAVGGTFWAMIVAIAQIVALASPNAGLIAVLYFIPGWLVYFGWVNLAAGRAVDPVSPRLFWVASAAVNLGYFVHEYQPWRYLGDYDRSLSGGAYWWLITGSLSIICAIFPGTKSAEQVGAPNPLPAE